MAVDAAARALLTAQNRAKLREVVIPDVVDPDRKERCRLSFWLFTQEYFRGRGDDFPDDPRPILTSPCGDFHRDICEEFQRRVLFGGLKAETAPRGYGKDSFVIDMGVIWAVLYGHSSFPLVIAYEANKAKARLAHIKMQLQENPLLAEDFPEVIAPIRHLGRSAQRAKYQLHRGKPTNMEWKNDYIILPTIEGSAASGCIVSTASLNGSIRGVNVYGRRPTLTLITDPQTRETANSAEQTAKILQTIREDIGGLGTRSQSASCYVLATIIKKDDVADQLTNRAKNPQWGGVIRRAIIEWPERMDLWQQYLDLKDKGARADDQDGREAHRFYLDRREEMDRGAVVLWPDGYSRRLASDGTQQEVSNLQSLFNEICKHGMTAFMSEYQNDPQDAEDMEQDITEQEICARLSGISYGIVPDGCDIVTRFIDIGTRVLWDCVLATDSTMSRLYVVRYDHYETFADHSKAVNPLAKSDPGRPAIERRVLELLRHLADEEVAGLVADVDGRPIRMDLTLVDTRFLDDVVQSFCKEAGPKYRPAGGLGRRKGQGVWGAARGADKSGDNWFAKRNKRRTMIYNVNTDHWKTFVRERLMQGEDTHGALLLYGDNPHVHRAFANHLLAERFDAEKGTWIQPSRAKPNHWLDCLAGCCVAASMCGASITGGKKKTNLVQATLKGWLKQ